MDTPVIEHEAEASAASPAASNPPRGPVPPEIALGLNDVTEEQFDLAIAETVKAVGGALLFQMKLDEGETSRCVAAVAIGAGETREIVIIDLPCDGGSVSVHSAEESALPIAAIASAYAGLAECWSLAA